MTDDRERLMKALDLHMPNWHIRYASQADLRGFHDTLQRRGVEKATEQLRHNVVGDGMLFIRAAIDAGLVKL